MKAVIICGGIIAGLTVAVVIIAHAKRVQICHDFSGSLLMWPGQTSISALSGSGATNSPHRLRWGLLSAKILDFGVKAGIGGFHPPAKQLTGKACNGVLSYS